MDQDPVLGQDAILDVVVPYLLCERYSSVSYDDAGLETGRAWRRMKIDSNWMGEAHLQDSEFRIVQEVAHARAGVAPARIHRLGSDVTY